MAFLDDEERREADELQREQIRELPWSEQLVVATELQRLAAQGYREDELLWAYERLRRNAARPFLAS